MSNRHVATRVPHVSQRRLGLRPPRPLAPPAAATPPASTPPPAAATPTAERAPLASQDPYAALAALSDEQVDAIFDNTALKDIAKLLEQAHPCDASFAFAGDNFGPINRKFSVLAAAAMSIEQRTYQRESPLADATQQAFQRAFADDPKAPVAAYMTPCGTAGNRLGFMPGSSSRSSIIFADNSHGLTREAGAHMVMNGAAATVLPTVDGKITAESFRKLMESIDPTYPNSCKPMGISISQPTEDGKLYTDAEVKAIADVAHEHGLLLQVDGARLFYAAAAAGKSLKEMTTDLGVDVVFLGGSKGGMLAAEATIFTPNFFRHNKEYVGEGAEVTLLQHLRTFGKQHGIAMGQAAMAMSQFIFALQEGHAVEQAERAIDYAKKLDAMLQRIPGLTLHCPTETNAVMVKMPKAMSDKLAEKYSFLVFKNRLPESESDMGVVRLMTNTSTTDEQIAQLERDLLELSAG